MSQSGSEDRSIAAEAKQHKLFVTGLDGKAQVSDLQTELTRLFSRHGDLTSVVVKKSYNQEYSYAFIDYKEDVDATPAIKQLNNSLVGNCKITVLPQDSSRRRKVTTEGCYECGKPGHFARNCRGGEGKNPPRSPSREQRSDRKKKKKRRHSSDYSRSRSRSERKRQKKKRSKSRDKKHSKSKKSKRDRRSPSSRSN